MWYSLASTLWFHPRTIGYEKHCHCLLVLRVLLHWGPGRTGLPGPASWSQQNRWGSPQTHIRLGPHWRENINFLAQPCFSTEQLVSPSLSAISPLPFNLFHFYFSSQVLFLCSWLLQWPFYRFPRFPLLFSCLLFCKRPPFFRCLCCLTPLFRMPFPSIHCYSPWDFFSCHLMDLNFDLYCWTKALSSFCFLCESTFLFFLILIILLGTESKYFLAVCVIHLMAFLGLNVCSLFYNQLL